MRMLGRLSLLLSILLCGALAFGQNVQITKGPVVEHTGEYTAVVAWSTNAPSSTIVRYGTNPNHLNQTAQMPWGGLTHRVDIRNLQPGTRYYFQVDSGQGRGSGTTAMSGIQQFTTQGGAQNAMNRNNGSSQQLQLTNGPVVEHVGSTNAQIAWTTDLPSSSIVRYGTNPNSLNQTAEQPWGATTHRVDIKNLQPNTQYYYSVHSAQGRNAPGQALNTPPQPFRTSGQ